MQTSRASVGYTATNVASARIRGVAKVARVARRGDPSSERAKRSEAEEEEREDVPRGWRRLPCVAARTRDWLWRLSRVTETLISVALINRLTLTRRFTTPLMARRARGAPRPHSSSSRRDCRFIRRCSRIVELRRYRRELLA